MALIHAALMFFLTCGFGLATASIGNRILCILGIEMDTEAEYVLICAGVGVLSVEMLLFGVEVTQHIRAGCFVVAGLLICFLVLESRWIAARLARIFESIFSSSRSDRALSLLIGIALGVEFLACLAPLTGSDALNYHFTAQKLILQHGYHPNLSLSLSLFCGQHHLLILFGLALGSENLAMVLIFLGGLLTAFSLASLASRWSPLPTALAITLFFLLTPVVFWQISSAGAPDVWMAFFASAAVIVLCQKKIAGTWRQALLAGLLTGGVAGAKYTGCLVAAGLAVALTLELRSLQKTFILCAGSLVTGAWPYLRNFVWTGDPVFPFLTPRLYPERVNLFTLKALLAETGAAEARHLAQFFPFVFFAGMRQNSLGFWDFFGPIVFALAPLLILASGSFRKWRVPAVVWWSSAVAIFFASGLPRFLLPVFPLGLACLAAGMAASQQRDWKVTNLLAEGLVILFCLIGGAGLVLYSWKPIEAALGLVSETSYLEARRPQYQEAEAINHLLGNQTKSGKTLVFLRHTYSLEIPYVNGDPTTSWLINPDFLRTPQDWQQFFQREGIAFVVRSPAYPAWIAAPLLEMEAKGQLVSVASVVVQDFHGNRIEENRREVSVVVLKVKGPAAH